MPTTSETRDAMIEALGAGAMTRAELVNALGTRGASGSTAAIARRVDDVVRRDTSFTELGERICYIPALVDGVAWTVPVEADDVANGYVRMLPALSPIGWWLVEHGADLVDGDGGVLGRLEVDDEWFEDRGVDVVRGPDGWLDPLVGGWATFTATAGSIVVERIESPPAPTDEQLRALRVGFALRATTDEVVLFDGERAQLTYADLESVVHGALLTDRDAFVAAPVPYLPDLVVAAGLEQRDETVAGAGFDWGALDELRRRNRMRAFYGLDDPQIDALLTAVGACRAYASEGAAALGPDEDQRDRGAILLAALLEEGPVTSAFWSECADQDEIADVAEFVGELRARMEGVPLAGVSWLASRCAEAEGDDQTAAALLDEIVASGADDHPPALIDAAALRADRGDAPGALDLLRRAGVQAADPDDEPSDAQRLLAEVIGFAVHRPAPTARRNDPCPCGSGRKYKACHLGKERHPLGDRASWLWDKACRFVRHHEPLLPTQIAGRIAVEAPGAYRGLRSSPFAFDIALHEYGMFSEFLERRGWLLPDDEAILGRQWTLVERSVFEVLEGRADRLRLRDIGTGDVLTVVNVRSTSPPRTGATMLGRPLPVGDSHRVLGGFVEVPRRLVNPLLDAIGADDSEELIALLASMFRPPQLRNTSGEALSLHTLRWELDDPANVANALAGAGFSGDDDTWTITADTPGMRDAILATLRLDPAAATLSAEVNSDERAALVIERVAAALPGAQLVADERRGLDDFDDFDDFDDGDDLDEEPGGRGSPGVDPDDPAIRAMIEELMIRKEIEWIDEEIPALGGRTPRDAVGDPVGREEVRQLLDSFGEPPPGLFGGFSAARLRALLGLDDD